MRLQALHPKDGISKLARSRESDCFDIVCHHPHVK
jgi:hypothetical protein